MTPPHTIIIGAGMGGLSAAIALASKGQRVTVCEQLSRAGGKMGEVNANGFRFDSGPSVITMRHVFEQLWRTAGRNFADDVQLLPLNPITRYFWRDGLVLDAVADQDAMCDNIRAFAPQDVDGYRRFMRYAKKLHDTIAEPFLYRQQPSVHDLFKLPVADVFKIDALRTLHQAVQAHFKDRHLIQLFDRFATYNGSSPYQAPATLNVIAHVEMAMGAWYPRGGVYELAKAFEKLALALGVNICYNTPVQEICVQAGTANGVRLRNGQVLPADAVIANVDVSTVREKLLPDIRHKKKQLEPSCSAFVLMLGVQGNRAQLAHHNIFFSDDYAQEFDDIFKRKVAPTDPTLYLCITSKTDVSHAPAGHENWFVLANAPYLSDQFDWAKAGDAYAKHIEAKMLSAVGCASPIVHRLSRWSPLDLQNTYGGNKGSIYGYSSNTKLAAFMRPNNRDKKIKKLYFASGSAHPGGGVPLVTLSGMAAAQCLVDDL